VTGFADARSILLAQATDWSAARKDFRWPDPVPFNWALDWFDGVLARDPQYYDQPALWLVETRLNTAIKLSFRQVSARSNRVANYLRECGLKRGDHLLLLLGSTVPLWETMLAAMKLGAVIIPATTLLTAVEIDDRIKRGRVKFIVAGHDQAAKFEALRCHDIVCIGVGDGESPGCFNYADAGDCSDLFEPDGPTGPDDPMLLYFTSGTTAQPKLVRHSHRSYPVGALSTMYWLGLRPGDVHLNISSPGWAKHAWSCFFAPWNAGATIFIANQPRFDAQNLLRVLEQYPVTTLCAPPTVWRLLIQEDLGSRKTSLREVCSAGEPLNPEVIDRVREAWGLTIRDGYGQTETTALVANSPGQSMKTGAMGRPLPGYEVLLLDPDGNEAEEGEVCLSLESGRPAGLMQGYEGVDGELGGIAGTIYRTGDIAFMDKDGYLTFVGRADDVFKSSDYRISPFELESALIEHPSVAEAAVVPSPDAIRLTIPKAYISLVPGVDPSRETAWSIFVFIRERLAPFKRVRQIEFVRELPKTISGKIRRVQLRRAEYEGGDTRGASGPRFSEDDFAEEKKR
jgi:acetyl-CoA synthetase